jgi:hypothetical protein
MQIREVIGARALEERETAVTMKEVEVRAITVAVYAAAGSTSGAKAAQKFTMMKRGPSIPQAPTVRELSKFFPAGTGEQGMFSAEEIAAEAARQAVIAGG